MSKLNKLKKFYKHSRKYLRTTLLSLAALCALTLLLLASLPALISSDFARGRVETTLAAATGKETHLKSLSFGWGGGLRITGLVIGRGGLEDKNFLARLDSFEARLDIPAALRGEIRLKSALQGLMLRLPPKEEPPKKPLADALREALASARTLLSLSLPGRDAALDVDLSGISALLPPDEQSEGGRPLRISGASLRAQTASLRAEPLRLSLAADVSVDKAAPSPVRLDAALSGFLGADGRLRPANASMEANATAPGLEFHVGGALPRQLNASLRLRLSEALAPVRALAPELPSLHGDMKLGLSAAAPDADHVNLGAVLFLDGLRASFGKRGGSEGSKSMGPLTLNLLQEAALDLAGQTLHLPGSLDLGPGGKVRWLAQVDGLQRGGQPRARVQVEELRLALGPLLPALRGMLPPGIALADGSLALESASLAAPLPAPGQSITPEVQLRGLDIALKSFAKSGPEGTLALNAARLNVSAASLAAVGAGKGSQASADLTARLDGVRRSGPKGAGVVRLGRVEVGRMALRGEGVAPEPAALFGLVGKGGVDLALRLEGVEAEGKVSVPALDASLRLGADLPAAKSAAVQVTEFQADAPALRLLPRPGAKAVEAPLRVRAQAPEILLAGAPLAPTVRGLKAEALLGRALAANIAADLAGPSGRELRTSGSAKIDVGQLLVLASVFAPPRAKASGEIAAQWDVDATLPAAEAPGPTANKPTPTPLQTLKGLSFVRSATATLRLDGVSLDLPLAAKPDQQNPTGEALRLRGFSTPRLLRFATRDGAAESTLTGALAFDSVEALPGAGRLDKPLSGLLTLNLAQQGGRSAQISEALRLEGLGLDQNLSLNLDKLDTLLARDPATADLLATALEGLDARLAFRLTTGVQTFAAASGKARALGGKGRLEAEAEAKLEGGKSLAFSTKLQSPGLDLSLGPDLAVSGLTSNVRFARRFELSPGLRCPALAGAELAPLSEQVFDQPLPQSGGQGRQEALGQLLRRRPGLPPDGVFALSRLRMKAAGLPLEIHDLELRLDTSGPLPGLRAFRAGLLGGNVLGSAMLNKSVGAAGRYSLEADLAFTGIDPARFFPAAQGRDPAGTSETSGRLTLALPLVPDAESLLQRLRLRADITRIGPRTLERMLYALDPQEQNETIVQQRRLMGMGYPRNLRIAAEYGNLSLTGAVEVKGFRLDLPPVDRLAIANLPLRDKLAKPLADVPALIRALDAASGGRICRDPADPKGALRFVEPAATKGAAR